MFKVTISLHNKNLLTRYALLSKKLGDKSDPYNDHHEYTVYDENHKLVRTISHHCNDGTVVLARAMINDDTNTHPKNQVRCKNQARCLTCYTTIASHFTHDFVQCRCKSDSETQIFVDGGYDYNRFGWGNKARWVDAKGKEWNAKKMNQKMNRDRAKAKARLGEVLVNRLLDPVILRGS